MFRKQTRSRRSKSRRPVFEGLESRQVMSLSSLSLSRTTLVLRADNAATSVNVLPSGSTIVIQDIGPNRSWSYPTDRVGLVEFDGGEGSDRFVNYVVNLPVRAYGSGGNDYL